jgi:hypothetical protein
MKIRLSLLLVLLLAVASAARADSLTEAQVAAQLTANSPLLLEPGVADTLATNLLSAQAANLSYTAFEPDSLQLSIDAVLRAIGLYVFPGGPTEIVNEQLTPIPFLQSEIAIDDRLTVSITPGGLDFGSQPVATPEPEEWILILTALVTFVTARLLVPYARCFRYWT